MLNTGLVRSFATSSTGKTASATAVKANHKPFNGRHLRNNSDCPSILRNAVASYVCTIGPALGTRMLVDTGIRPHGPPGTYRQKFQRREFKRHSSDH